MRVLVGLTLIDQCVGLHVCVRQCVFVCKLMCVGGGFPGEAEHQSWPCSLKEKKNTKHNNLFIGIAQISSLSSIRC